MDDDNTLPSQFSHPREALTSWGAFIIKHKIVMNTVVTTSSPYHRLFPDLIHYDMTFLFPNMGMVNLYRKHHPLSKNKISVFDQLALLVGDLQELNDSRMTANYWDTFRTWCKDKEMDDELLTHYKEFRAISEAEKKMRTFMPQRVWREMLDARAETKNNELDDLK